jgi:hypothetical protein
VLATFQQHFTVDNHIIYPNRLPPHPLERLVQGLRLGPAWLGGNGVGVKDGDIGGFTQGDKATVMVAPM